jgi:hypothetical protein
MSRLTRLFIAAAIVLLGGTGSALALQATAGSNLALRAGPGTNHAVLLTIPAGASVAVDECSSGWCAVRYSGTPGYTTRRGLFVRRAVNPAKPQAGPEVWPIYRAGHYPKADWYYGMPPYTAISPSFYHRRFFMMAQERDRYRYMPHVFRNSGAYGDGGGPIEDVDIQAVAAGLALGGAYGGD